MTGVTAATATAATAATATAATAVMPTITIIMAIVVAMVMKMTMAMSVFTMSLRKIVTLTTVGRCSTMTERAYCSSPHDDGKGKV